MIIAHLQGGPKDREQVVVDSEHPPSILHFHNPNPPDVSLRSTRVYPTKIDMATIVRYKLVGVIKGRDFDDCYYSVID